MTCCSHVLAVAILAGSAFAQTPTPAPKPAVTALAITPDGTRFVTGSQAGVFLRSWKDETAQRIVTELENVHHLAFSPDGSTLAVAGGTPGEFGSVELWSWPERKLVRQLEGHDDLVYDLSWLADGKTIVTAGADRAVRVWEVASGKQTASLVGHSGPVLCSAVSPDGKLLCTGSADQTIRVWDTTSWQLVRSMTNHLGPVHALAFRAAPANELETKLPSLLASAGGDSTVRIWRPEIGRLVRIVRHTAPVHCLAWDSAGRLYSGAKDGRLQTIDAETGSFVHEERRSNGWLMSLAVTPSETTIVSGDSLGEVRISRQNE